MKKVWVKDKKFSDEKNITVAFSYNASSRETLVLKVSAANIYQIFCNGRFVAYGPMRNAHRHSWMRAYDICPDQDNNLHITVIVNSTQINSFEFVKEPPFFCAQIEKDGKVIADSYSFSAYLLDDRIQKVQRYSFQRTFAESYVMDNGRQNLLTGKECHFKKLMLADAEGNQIFINDELSEPDYHREQAALYEWGKAHFDRNRKAVHARYVENNNIDGYLMYDISELDELLCDEAVSIICNPEEERQKTIYAGSYRAYRFSKNKTGFFNLDIDVLKSAVVYLLFDETAAFKPDEGLYIDTQRLNCCNAVKYRLANGHYNLMTFLPYTAQFVRIAVFGGNVILNDFSITTLENPDARPEFECNDPEIKKIADAAVETFRQNAVDILTDCPSRERAGWLCDSYFSSIAEKFLTGNNKVEKNTLNCFLSAPELPFAKGMLPMCYPADHIEEVYIPNWNMWFIIELKSYFDRSGDEDFVSKCKEKVYRIIGFLERYKNQFNLLENLEGWVFVEWSKSNDFTEGINFPSNMLYVKALKDASELFDDKNLAKKADETKKSILHYSFNGMFFVDQAFVRNNRILPTENITETCQYYALWTGIADKQTHRDFYDRILNGFSVRNDKTACPKIFPSNAFIGRLLRLDYFFREKEYAKILEEIKSYYLPMAEKTGTLWENLTPDASCNHGFASYIAVICVSSYRNLNN